MGVENQESNASTGGPQKGVHLDLTSIGRSKDINDKVGGKGSVAKWDDVINGIDQGDGWVSFDAKAHVHL